MNASCLLRAASRLAALAIALGAAAVSAAPPQRTFVASTGNDANVALNCNLANPCRSFASAMSVTATDGEIIVLDSAGYGAVVIDRSVSIIASPGVYAGISVFTGGTGVTIATSGIRVALRGLIINGQLGDYGIDVGTPANVQLTVENCVVSTMQLDGIRFQSVNGDLRVRDTIVRRNKRHGLQLVTAGGHFDNVRFEDSDQDNVLLTAAAHATFVRSAVTGSALNGVSVLSTVGTGVPTTAAFDAVTVSENGGNGVVASTAGVNNQTRVSIVRSTVTHNGGDGVSYAIGPEAGAQSWMFINATEITDNGASGVVLGGCGALGTAVALVSHSQIAHNGTGFVGPPAVPPPGCQLRTNGTNQLRANGTNFTGVITSDPGD